MKIRLFRSLLIVILVVLPVLFYSSTVNGALDRGTFGPNVTPTPLPTSAKSGNPSYRGVVIGTLADEVRTKLGEPKETSEAQDYYQSEGENTQVLYDANRKVKTISTSYFGPNMKPPTPKELFGIDVVPGADGSINKIERYPKAGYWISYIRTGGDDPMVMVTIQKMERAEQ